MGNVFTFSKITTFPIRDWKYLLPIFLWEQMHPTRSHRQLEFLWSKASIGLQVSISVTYFQFISLAVLNFSCNVAGRFLAAETNPPRECELPAQWVVLMNTLFADSGLVLARLDIKGAAAVGIYVFTCCMCFQRGSGVSVVAVEG